MANSDRQADDMQEPLDLADEGVSPLFPVVYEVDYPLPAGDPDGWASITQRLYRSRHSEVVVQAIEVISNQGDRTVTVGEYGQAGAVASFLGATLVASLPFLEDSAEGLAVKRQLWPEAPTNLAEERRRRKRGDPNDSDG